MQKFKLLILFALTSLSACVFPGVYRIDVQQGNIVEAEAIDKLKEGMSRRQVHFVLGNPLVKSPFDPSEEIYLYTIQLEGGEIHEQKIVLAYDDDILRTIDHSKLLQPELANPGLVYKIKGEPANDPSTPPQSRPPIEPTTAPQSRPPGL